jgi:hypothetical protein
MKLSLLLVLLLPFGALASIRRDDAQEQHVRQLKSMEVLETDSTYNDPENGFYANNVLLYRPTTPIS